MDYAYFIENTTEEYVDNSALFQLIQDLDIEEDEVYIDTGNKKVELFTLLELIEASDRLVIRSIVDIQDDFSKLLVVLAKLQEREILLCSVSEPSLNGLEYYTIIKAVVEIRRYYSDKKRQEGFERAKEEGLVGRPRMTAEVEKAVRLYKTKAFTTTEIENLSGVSSSTLYRALKEQ